MQIQTGARLRFAAVHCCALVLENIKIFKPTDHILLDVLQKSPAKIENVDFPLDVLQKSTKP